MSVFDSSAAAQAAAAQRRNHDRYDVDETTIVVKNVVYTGKPSAAARRAMESLTK